MVPRRKARSNTLRLWSPVSLTTRHNLFFLDLNKYSSIMSLTTRSIANIAATYDNILKVWSYTTGYNGFVQTQISLLVQHLI